MSHFLSSRKTFERFFLLTCLFLGSSAVFAGEKKHDHRHHEAHVHGAAQLQIAFEKLEGKIEFEAAAEGVLGFEHKPSKDKDKKKLIETIAFFETNIGKMVLLDSSLACAITKEEIDLKFEDTSKDHQAKGQHSNFIARFNVKCQKSPLGSQIKIDFKNLKKLEDIDLVILIDDLQKSIEIKKSPLTVDLK